MPMATAMEVVDAFEESATESATTISIDQEQTHVEGAHLCPSRSW